MKACTKIRLTGGELKIKRNEIKSKTVKERIISPASVEYVIVVKKGERKQNISSMLQQNTLMPWRSA